MAKKSKSISRLPQLGIGVLCLVSFFAFLSLFYLNYINQTEIKSLKDQETKNQNLIHASQSDLTILKEELDSVSNFDEKIKELKTIYFSNIKQLEDNIQQGLTTKRIAYLTFDDGPYANITGKFLDILKEYDVPATFFVLGKPSQSELYKREIREGHTLANHTYSHKLGKNGIYTTADTAVADFMKLDNYIKENYQYEMDVYRFPGGSPTAGNRKSSIVSQMADKGYGYVDWGTTDGSGGTRTSVEDYYNSVVKGIGNQKIVVILMHDYSDLTLGMLPDLIEYLNKENFIMLPLFNESIKVIKS